MRNFLIFTILGLTTAVLILAFKVNELQYKITKTQSLAAIGQYVVDRANSAPTNMTGVLIYVSRQK